MVTRFLLIAFLFIYTPSSYGQKNKKSLDVDSLRHYMALGDFEKAILFLDQEIKNNPSPDLFMSRGLAKIETNKLNEALLDLRQSLKLRTQNDTSYYNIGYV